MTARSWCLAFAMIHLLTGVMTALGGTKRFETVVLERRDGVWVALRLTNQWIT